MLDGAWCTECSGDYLCICNNYLLKIEDQHFAIWDTAGLDKGTQGTVPAEKTEAYLKQLLHDLAYDAISALLFHHVFLSSPTTFFE